MSLNIERAERLEMLANRLDQVSARNFDLKTWVDYSKAFKVEGGDGTCENALCGTTACAIGWAALTPSIAKRTGLCISVIDGRDNCLANFTEMSDLVSAVVNGDVWGYAAPAVYTPGVMPARSYQAASKAFMISADTAHWLFCDKNYDSPNDIAEVSRRLRYVADLSRKKKKEVRYFSLKLVQDGNRLVLENEDV